MAKPDAIRPVTDSKHIFWCNYGVPGVGKTRLAGTGSRTLIVRPPMDHTNSIVTPGVEEWVVNGWNDMNEVEEYARHEGGKNHDWIWLDSISLFQDAGLDEIWTDLIAAKPHRAQFGLDKGEYGVNMTRLARWVRSMVGMDAFNFGVTAHPFESTFQDEEILMPYVQGKQMAEKICGYMSLVTYYELVKQKSGKEARVLRTSLTEKYYAKDQYTAFPNNRLVNPTVPKVEELIKKSRPAPAKKTTARRRTTTKRRST